MYTVYILECGDKSLYTGITTDMNRRFREHSEGKGGRYTRAKKVKRILYTETQPTKRAALKREIEIKQMKRVYKTDLINNKH